MDYKRIGFIISILLLILMSACGPAGVTPAPQGPGAGQIQNNPIEQNQYMSQENSSQLKTAVPATIPARANPPGGVGPIAANPGNVGSVPQLAACNPPVPSISNVNSFCANPAAGLGGATWDQNPPDGDPSVAKDTAFTNNSSGYPDCNWNQSKTVCSGPQDTKVSYEFCTTCGGANSVTQYDATFGPNVCSKGWEKNSNGACTPAFTYCFAGPGIPGSNCPPDDSHKPNYGYYCPSGSHYDNTLQNCADDATNQLASACPPSYPYFLPDYHLCLAKAYSIVYDCQIFTIPLGECAVKKVCQQPAGGCGINLNGTKKSWNEATCSCK